MTKRYGVGAGTREFSLIAFGFDGKALLSARHVPEDEARTLAESWFTRDDVDRVEGEPE